MPAQKERKKFMLDLGELARADLAFRFKYAENIAGDSFDFAKRKEILGIWVECLRNLLLSRFERGEKREEKFSHYSINKIEEEIKGSINEENCNKFNEIMNEMKVKELIVHKNKCEFIKTCDFIEKETSGQYCLFTKN